MDATTLIELVVAVLLPVGIGYSVVALRRLPALLDRRRVPAPRQPIERLHADLRRLHDLLAATENADDLPAKNQRCVATRAAYVDALSAACRQLELAPPVGRPVPRTEIYRVEADLRRAGVDVRPTG